MVQKAGLKKILVTGGSGMIGRAIISRLVGSNQCLVRAQVRDRLDARSKMANGVDLTVVDLQAADFTRIGDQEMRALTRDIEFVVHAAGLVHQEAASYQEYEVVNVRATQQLAEACIANGVHTLVFLSTSAVYGKGPFKNISEAGPYSAKTPYAVSKMTSENYLQTLAQKIPRIIVLRPSMVFGEGDRGNLLSLIRQIKEEKYVHIGSGSTQKSLIYSKDLAAAVHLCLQKVPNGYHVFNVANPIPVSMKDLADNIAATMNITKKFSSVPEGLLKMGLKAVQAFMPGKINVTPEQIEKLATETTLSTDSLIASTGFAPATNLQSAIKAEVDWATANKLI